MVSGWFAFCSIALLFVILPLESEGLQYGGVGTCRGKVSVIDTKKVSYYTTVYCKGKKICRWKRWKVVSYVKWKMGTICCGGWQHDADLDVCKPICRRGCLNGTCVAPEKCQCDPPMYLDPSRPYVCLAPVCDSPCFNSICTRKPQESQEATTNGVCECLNNTRRYNETHCAFCDENYKINPNLTCTPECSTPCVNSECIAPDKCKCLEGFARVDDFTCEPNCPQCVNGTCVGSKCECLPGFSAVNDTHCVRCDCENGECVSGQCVCREGYILVDGVCEPVCSCVNGVCTAPGECLCYEGYYKSPEDAGVCCRPECGQSCDANGECPSVACVASTGRRTCLAVE